MIEASNSEPHAGLSTIQDEGTGGMSTGTDDDMLSIMCDDIDVDDLLGACEEKMKR